MPQPRLSWKNIEDLAIRLAEVYPDRDPLTVRFTELKQLVEALPDFAAEPGHPCNESILEAIQAAWHEEHTESRRNDEDEPGYQPPNPFRP